ncbi:MAG TPA: protein translocase subunit SecD [Iamia sp.]|nr:protein translocase subunit SecD [Iamia sp.]
MSDDDPVEETAPKPKSGPPPRPGKAAKRDRTAPPPRPKAAKGSRKARRRRIGGVEGAVIVTALLLIARIVTLAIDDAKASTWAWILLALAAGAFVWSLIALADKRGRLTQYRNRGLGALALILALAAFSITTVVANDASPQLGLDLQGGFSVVLSAEGNPPSDSIDQAMEIIRNRIDGLGVAEPEVTRQGDNVVVDLPGIEDRERAQEILGETARLEFRPVLQPQLPYDAEAAAAGEDPCAGAATPPADDTTTTAPADGSTTTAPADGATTTAPADGSTTTASTEPATSEEEGAARPAPTPAATPVDGEYAAAPLARQEDTTTTAAEGETTTTAAGGETTTTAAEGETTTTVAEGDTTTTAPAADPAAEAANTIIIPFRADPDEEPISCTQVGPTGFEGGDLSKSQAELGGQTGSQWVVSIAIKGGSRSKANELINSCASPGAACPTGQMAIVLDNEVISAPQVNGPNLADQDFQIEGQFSEGDAKDLALKLRYGALPVEFVRSAERQVSPTLGEDSLQAGLLAGVIGLVAVALYLIVYYRALGVVVVLGLGVWSALMYGTICWLSTTRGLTLSLSGVVGIVVSLGTTVDSYVVHFERLKDEVRLGKSVRASTEKGFQKAFKTILTADLASLMGAALLWYLTVGAVRGFAFFLGLSVVLDLLVAYCFDRPMVALLARSRFFTEHPIFGVARGLGRSGDGSATPRPTEAAGVGS